MLKDLGASRILALGGITLATAAFIIYLATQVTEGPKALLYGDLSFDDSSQIITKLEQMGINYELKGDGQLIYVPKKDVSRLRLVMAEDGLPSGGSIGYEIFDNMDAIGTTSFVQNINKLRALEGELSRTISSLQNVKSARVHLVLPQREVFSRKKEEARASVTIHLNGNSKLKSGQILSIQHIVAAAVPKLSPTDVSIIDNRGMLLARGGIGNDPGDIAIAQAEEKQASYEKKLSQSIEELLFHYVGYGNARVEVRTDINFDRITENSEIYDPDGQVARSTQVIDSNENSKEGGSDAATISQNLPGGQLGLGDDGGTASSSKRVEEITNFEISKTTRLHVKEPGQIEKISVAVLIDGTYKDGENGERLYQARSEDEIEKIKSLVKTSIGYDEKRGDTIEVVNLPFKNGDEDANISDESASLLSSNDITYIVERLIFLVVSLLVILFVAKPIMRFVFNYGATSQNNAGQLATAQQGEAGQEGGANGEEVASEGGDPAAAIPAPDGSQPMIANQSGSQTIVNDSGIEEMIDLGQVEGQVRASSLKKIGDLVENHPTEAAAIVRSWMYEKGQK